jgi:phosphatidylserine/phosphatidylglycerophosphate/cardiolipin synthase-like enzyme
LSLQAARHIKVLTTTNPTHGNLVVISHWSHHQKIIIIDRQVAFVGGVDITGNRWDTPEHRCMPTEPKGAWEKTRDRKYPGVDYYSPAISEFQGDELAHVIGTRGLGGLSYSLQDPAMTVVHKARKLGISGYKKLLARRMTDLSASSETRVPLLPRMPWHDMSLRLEGPVVESVLAVFANRWSVASGPDLMIPNLPCLPPDATRTCPCLVLQSLPMYADGMSQRTIRMSWASSISNAKHFILIEQQYFSTFMNISDDEFGVMKYVYDDVFKDFMSRVIIGHGVKAEYAKYAKDASENDLYEHVIRCGDSVSIIGWAIAHRIKKAIEEGDGDFRVRIVIPAFPDGFGDPRNFDWNDKVTQTVEKKCLMLTMALQYMSTMYIRRVAQKYIGEVKANPINAGKPNYQSLDADKLFKVYCLRSHGTTESGFPVTEQIYPHIKVLITDDVVICGSANLNERSMSGYRDSEIAIMVASEDTASTTLEMLAYEHSGGETCSAGTPIRKFEIMDKIADANTKLYVEAFNGTIPEGNLERQEEYRQRATDLQKMNDRYTQFVNLRDLVNVAERECKRVTLAHKTLCPESGMNKESHTALSSEDCKELGQYRNSSCVVADTERKRLDTMSSDEGPVKKMKDLLGKVVGQLTLAPTTWMREDMHHIADFTREAVFAVSYADTVHYDVEGNPHKFNYRPSDFPNLKVNTLHLLQ